jgi:hypothetical protein
MKGKARKPFGVWLLLDDGEPWMVCRDSTLSEALKSAGALREAGNYQMPPMFRRCRAWIAEPVYSGTRERPALPGSVLRKPTSVATLATGAANHERAG